MFKNRLELVKNLMQIMHITLKPSSGILIFLYALAKPGYNATHDLHTSSWDTWHAFFSDQTISYIHMYIVNHFRNKILCSQRNGHIMQILGRIPRKKGLYRGDFWFVRRKRHARVRSIFFRSRHGVGRLITYQV